MNIGVITGASSGIGREFVLRLAEKHNFDEIWLIARRAGKLEELAKELQTKVRVLALDLTKTESVEEYAQELKRAGARVSVLVNASGFGRFGAFEDISLSDMMEMTDLNSKALVAMTYATLPYMDKGGEIYQMGSLSSFQPVPYIGVYAASKAYVLSFSRSLNRELKSRGIKCMAVCPGWVKTDFF
ncbi:MAG: SDR family NAD(P)-dependent oxidoreductase, partial [Clostridia bacterium]|nr:SDR family NAD(P)-dependent oxidoreductase [Clostridia bacterium]